MNKFLMGKVLKPKGLDGTFKCEFIKNDSSEIAQLKKIFVGGNCFNVLRAYGNGQFAFFKVAGIENFESAQQLVGKQVEIERESGANLNDGEFYAADFIGCTVFFENGTKLGELIECESYGGGDVFSIITVRGEILVPFVNGLVEELNVNKKTVVFSKKTFSEVCDEI